MGIVSSVHARRSSLDGMQIGPAQCKAIKPIFHTASREVLNVESPSDPLTHKEASTRLFDRSYRPFPTKKNTSKYVGRETPAGLSMRANRLNETISIPKISSSKISPKPSYFSRIWACVAKLFSWIWR